MKVVNMLCEGCTSEGSIAFHLLMGIRTFYESDAQGDNIKFILCPHVPGNISLYTPEVNRDIHEPQHTIRWKIVDATTGMAVTDNAIVVREGARAESSFVLPASADTTALKKYRMLIGIDEL